LAGPTGGGTTDRADEVTLSRKGAKSRTRVGGLRPTGTKAGTRVASSSESQAALIKKLKSLEKTLDVRTRELGEAREHLAEALEQQTATSEVLSVISSSPGELEPVFQAMLENARRICGAKFGALWRFEDGAARIVSQLGYPPAFAEFLQRGSHRPGPLNPLTRVVETLDIVHIADYRADRAYLDGDPLAVAG
jgi:hypothetical protein